MTHPYITINKESWGTVLKSYTQALALIADKELGSLTLVESQLAQYAAVINTNSSQIFELAASGIQQYLNFYRVSPQEGIYDEFKNIYFLGSAISETLKASGLADLNKLHQKAMLRLLDFRLQHPFKAYRPALSSRLVAAINNNTVQQHFGSYGWYIIYKCLYNAAANSRVQTV